MRLKRILKLFNTKSPQPVRIGLWAFKIIQCYWGIYDALDVRQEGHTILGSKKSSSFLGAVLIN